MNAIESMLKSEYANQKNLLSKLKKRYSSLSAYDNMTLTYNKSRNKFYVHKKGDPRDKRKYCNKNDAKLIANVQEFKYLKVAIARINVNLMAIMKFLASYKSPYPTDVIKNLGNSYRNLDNISRVFSNYISSSDWLKKRKAEKEAHIRQHGEYHPEFLTHRTIDGTYTRSKSEVSIYNYLLMKGVIFIYEPIMMIGDEWKRPDFLILTDDGRELIIEHLGLSGDSGYLSDQLHKIELYIQNNWIPNENLLLTFDDKYGNIDMKTISKMIDAFLSKEA